MREGLARLLVVLGLISLAAAQFPNPTKYDFQILGCFEDKPDRDLPTVGWNPSNNPTGISADYGLSLSMCGRACQILGFRYAGAQNGNECYCGNSYNKHNNKFADSECSVSCAGDDTEKCGAPWKNTILDLSTVPGTICPPAWPHQGSLCCPERASFTPVDQQILDDLRTLFPENDFRINSNGGLTAQQLAQRQAYLDSKVSPNIFFVTEGSFNITLLADGAGYRNQIGYFLLNNNGAILNTYQDIFGDSSWDKATWKNPNNLPWKSCVPRLGLTATRGPFPAGTGIGFFIHADGASSAALSDPCKNSDPLRACLKRRGPRDYGCYRENSCSIDASKDPINSLNTFSSIDSLNGDNKRHVAIINSQYGLILGFEDLWDLGDQDYNDAMFLITYTGEITGNFPKLCDPSCNTMNGKCNYTTGTCTCNAATGVTFDSVCNCDGCPNCSSAGGTCKCSGSSKTCECKNGFQNSPAGNDCACSTDRGRCFGVSGTYSCGKCTCQSGYSNPTNSGLIGGIYKFNFGPSTVATFGGYTVESGAVISGTAFGSRGWSTDHTSQGLKYNDAENPNSSTMRLARNAQWSIFLSPDKDYDVTITFGSQQDSSHSLNLVGASTIPVVSNKQLGVNEYFSVTSRIRTTSQGKLTLQEPNIGADFTRITSVVIEVPPCSCLNCTGGCGSGTCDCYTGRCSCPPGFGGANCEQCLAGFYGPTCQACPTCNGKGTCSQGINGFGNCTCNVGWTGTNCQTCASGYFGSNCSPCPSCVPGQGTCNQGINGNGTCTCLPNFSGTLCQNCASGFGGSSCTPCPPSCGQGSCSQGITGTGLCVCNSGWTGANCSSCATGFYGSNCTQCPTCNGKGTCNQGNSGNGQCTCSTGWTGANCDSCAIGFIGTNCNPCHLSCATCSGTGASECVTCASGLLALGSTCVQTCPTGYFKSGNACVQCNPTCLTCFGASGSQCSTCNATGSTPFYQGGQCLPTCSSNFFATGLVCSQCSPNCASCAGSSTTCTSCTPPLSLSAGQCVSSCPAGTFSSSNVCQPCSQNCATCSGASTACTTCPNGNVLFSGTCVPTCPNGFYADGSSVCQPCQAPCATCTGAATTCDTCVESFFHQITQTCTSNCSANQYPNGTSCQACDPTCATCTGPTSCTSCPDGKFLQNGECLDTCGSQYFVFGTNCFPCDSNCATCTSSSTQCATCSDPLALSSNTCVSACPPGTWKNGNTCEPCGGNCATCTGGAADNCLTCDDPAQYALQGTTCKTNCDPGFFKDPSGVCVRCHETCQTCNNAGASSCETCAPGFLKYGSTCLTQCPPHAFEDGGSCTNCTQPCASCTGSSSTCTSCLEGATPFLQNNQCVPSCALTEYLSGSTCLPCHDTCSTCNGGTSQSCASCTGSLFLLGTECVPQCPSNQFANNSTNTCDNCHPSCLTCSGPQDDNCLTCNQTALDGSTCVDKCPDGKFWNSFTNTCDPCFFICDTCFNSTENGCFSCEDPLSLFGSTCILTCPDGTFSSDNQCLPCDDNCATCSGTSTTCLTCPPGTAMLNNHCYETCPDGYFKPLNGLSCETCLPPRDCLHGVSICSTGECNCTGTGFKGPFCDCSEDACPTDATGAQCSGLYSCTCGECPCDPSVHWGPACQCKMCPGGLNCSKHGICNCDGTCTCDEGFVGSDCSIECIYDDCGVCFGNGMTCAGCDGVSNSGKVFDACGVCDGNNSTCSDCDGVPIVPGRPFKVKDACGVCGGDGGTCRNQLLCGKRTDCDTCNVAIGQSERRKCVWCNSTSSCVPIEDGPLCNNLVEQCSPTTPVENLTGNEGGISTGAIIGSVMGAVVAGAAVAGLVYMAKLGKGPLHFEPVNFDENNGAINNPLYQEYSPNMENPLYVPPS